MSKATTHHSRQRGLTLVEIMIALVLSLILMAAVINMFVGNRQTYRTTDAVSLVQEAGRYALDALAYDLRMVGHQGCPTRSGVNANDINNVAGYVYPAEAIEGLDGADDDTDALTIRYAEAGFNQFSAAMLSTGANFQVTVTPTNPMAVEAGDIALVSDCAFSDLVRVDSVAGSTVTHSGTALNYDTRARLSRMQEVIYTVQDTGRVNGAGNAIFALYRNGQEVVEGVENLQVRYGIVVPGTTNISYVNWAGAVGQQIVAVRIGMLIASIEPVADATPAAEQQFDVAGVTVTVDPDRRLRRVFSTTVDVRNW